MARGLATKEAYLPWLSDSAPQPIYEGLGTNTFVEITVMFCGGSASRSRTLAVPLKLTCADLKGQLAVEGVVSTCGGLEVFLEESCTAAVDDCANLSLVAGQVLFLCRAASQVSVTALAMSSDRTEEEVYELVVPNEVTGAKLRDAIEQATCGALRVAAIYLAEAADAGGAHAVADDEVVCLVDDQAIIVERMPDTAVKEAPASKTKASSGLFAAIKARLYRSPAEVPGRPASFGIRAASNIKVSGTTIAASGKEPWSSCVVFDVTDHDFFELTVRLLADAPAAEAEGLSGRWMIGIVPLASSAVKTEADRRRLLDEGYFLTVCHGHPAKLHAPSTTRGSCGEDFAALPGDLSRGQTLTLRWASVGSTLSAQVDEFDAVTLPYCPRLGCEVRPCLVFGQKPAEISVVGLGKDLGGA